MAGEGVPGKGRVGGVGRVEQRRGKEGVRGKQKG